MELSEDVQGLLLGVFIADRALGLGKPVPGDFIVGPESSCAFKMGYGLVRVLGLEADAAQAYQGLFKVGEALEDLLELLPCVVEIAKVRLHRCQFVSGISVAGIDG